MLKKTITYEDFDGNKCIEDFYFNLNKLEVEELQMSVDGGLSVLLESLIPEEYRNGETNPEDLVLEINQNTRDIWNLVKLIIESSYGIKSEDGKRFKKSPEILNEFKETNAYVELIMELATNPDSAEKFIDGVFSSIKNA